ncbi:YHS domain-containing protein [Vibrio sp. SCSIO 43135]|nr:YHS domain-containing (seleno)protein [Vibrio sp. SCSIO 43135]USD41742.1 YHS domain-containing protein [Vibrio sp. SCSIO 43135]
MKQTLNSIKVLLVFIALFTSALFTSSVSYAEDEIYTGIFSNKALAGYDTVAYFTENKPVKGSSKFQTEYKGADWYFSSQQNLDAFVAEPEKYAPQYGGYCAWAVSAKNDFAPGDPHEWSLVDGKLYLNYDDDIKQRWEQDRTYHITQADKNWPNLIN